MTFLCRTGPLALRTEPTGCNRHAATGRQPQQLLTNRSWSVWRPMSVYPRHLFYIDVLLAQFSIIHTLHSTQLLYSDGWNVTQLASDPTAAD